MCLEKEFKDDWNIFYPLRAKRFLSTPLHVQFPHIPWHASDYLVVYANISMDSSVIFGGDAVMGRGELVGWHGKK
jgi:hypothetical protein